MPATSEAHAAELYGRHSTTDRVVCTVSTIDDEGTHQLTREEIVSGGCTLELVFECNFDLDRRMFTCSIYNDKNNAMHSTPCDMPPIATDLQL